MSITVIDVFNVLDHEFAAFRPGAQPKCDPLPRPARPPLGRARIRLQQPSFVIRRPMPAEAMLFVVRSRSRRLAGRHRRPRNEHRASVFLPMSLGLLAVLVDQPHAARGPDVGPVALQHRVGLHRDERAGERRDPPLRSVPAIPQRERRLPRARPRGRPSPPASAAASCSRWRSPWWCSSPTPRRRWC